MERICFFLLEMAQRGGAAESESVRVDLRMYIEDITDYLGLNAETVSRLFHPHQEDGLVIFLSPTAYVIPDHRGAGPARATTPGQPFRKPGEYSRGPTSDDIAQPATMPDAERAGMIEGMCVGLASRVEKDPNESDGWPMLIKFYSVLGEGEIDNASVGSGNGTSPWQCNRDRAAECARGDVRIAVVGYLRPVGRRGGRYA